MPAVLNIPPPQASKSFGSAGNSPGATIDALQVDARQAAILSLEGLALQYGMMPLTLLRES
ncbi:MAG: hypothetical protein ACK5TH_21895, partial [Prosthecobacter sp.]